MATYFLLSVKEHERSASMSGKIMLKCENGRMDNPSTNNSTNYVLFLRRLINPVIIAVKRASVDGFPVLERGSILNSIDVRLIIVHNIVITSVS